MSEVTQNVEVTTPETTVDPFAIFNTDVNEIKSFEEKDAPAREQKDWSSIYFEPDPKNATDKTTYQVLVKFLPNIYDATNPFPLKVYYRLPNPNKPNEWKFNYESPKSLGKKEKCIVADKFFATYKSEDARIAAIAKQLKRNQYRCGVIQVVLDKNNPDNNGKLFLFKYPEGMHVDTIIQAKVNPSVEDIEMGKKKENITDPFYTRYMILKVTQDANGRNFTQSSWTDDDVRGGMIIDGRKLTDADRGNAEIQAKIIELLKAENINIKEHFMYKPESEEKLKFVQRAIDVMFGDAPAGNVTQPTTNTVPAAPVATPAAQTPSVATTTTATVTTPAPTPAAQAPVETKQPENTAATTDDDFIKSLNLG